MDRVDREYREAIASLLEPKHAIASVLGRPDKADELLRLAKDLLFATALSRADLHAAARQGVNIRSMGVFLLSGTGKVAAFHAAVAPHDADHAEDPRRIQVHIDRERERADAGLREIGDHAAFMRVLVKIADRRRTAESYAEITYQEAVANAVADLLGLP